MLQLRSSATLRAAPCAGRERRARADCSRSAVSARAAVASTARDRWQPGGLRSAACALLAACLLAVAPPASRAEVCTAAGVCTEQREEVGDLAAVLRARSAENKASNDARRLDSFYKREWRVNKLLRADALPEPCDPRQPEFASRCLVAGIRRADELR